MRIQCPKCSSQYEVEAEYVGRNLKCPDCGHEFEVHNPNLIPCPDCFMQISKRANTCPHCGAVLNASAVPMIHQTGKKTPLTIESEQEIMLCHPSVMNYLWLLILGIITIPILIGFLILLGIWFQIHFTTYRITTLRIIIRRGLIAKIQNEIWIKDMRGANLIQNIWQRLIGVGNISLGTAATAETEICMIGIANPQKVIDTINSLRS